MDAFTGIFSLVPLDWCILGGIVILSALDSLRSGIGRTAALVVALPIAFFVYSLIPKAVFLGSLGLFQSDTMSAATFAALSLLLFFIVRRMGLEYVDGGMGQPIQAGIAGMALAAVCMVVFLEVSFLGNLWQFGSNVQTLFAEQFRLFWVLGAYAALAFARG